MGIQARTIVRLAKKHGLELRRLGTGQPNGEFRGHCARAVLAQTVGKDVTAVLYCDETTKLISEKFGLTSDEIQGLEGGFEGTEWQRIYSKRYFKVGQRAYELSRVI